MDYDDKMSMVHDINYMLSQGIPRLLRAADEIYLKRIGWSNPIITAGIKMRQFLRLYEGQQSDPVEARHLRDLVVTKYPELNGDFIV